MPDRLTVDTINSDQLDRLINLLERTGAYLDAIHGVGRHDSIGPAYSCSGCEIYDQIQAALARGGA